MRFITSINSLDYNKKNKILYFFCDEMIYHKKFITMLENLEKENPLIAFTGINIEIEKNLNLRFNFKSVPCLIFYWNDIEVFRKEGMLSTADLKKTINKFNK